MTDIEEAKLQLSNGIRMLGGAIDQPKLPKEDDVKGRKIYRRYMELMRCRNQLYQLIDGEEVWDDIYDGQIEGLTK